MNVLMWMNASVGTIPGGHRVQMDKTAAALRALGVAVQTSSSPDLGECEADIVHGFGLTLEQILEAKRRDLPVALSTIYWDRRYYRRIVLASSRRDYGVVFARQMARSGVSALRLSRPWYASRRELYESADLLLPNSRGESNALKREVRVRTPIHVIPNGVDPTVFRLPASTVTRNYVAYVGRLEPHKNQLGLIRALRNSGLRLVLVGADHPHHARYADECRAAANGEGVEFVPELAQADLAAVYGGARVHVMPSFFETTGLASLEAAACGCAVVSTRDGWARDYFDDLATYCHPTSRRSIRAAVERAWSEGPRAELRERVLARYTWAHAARATLRAYEWLRAQTR